MQRADIPNFLDILAVTPVRQWSHLDRIYDLKNVPDKPEFTRIETPNLDT